MKAKSLLMLAALVGLLAVLALMMHPLLNDAGVWPPILFRTQAFLESGGTASPCLSPNRGTLSPRFQMRAEFALFIVANLTMIVVNRLDVYTCWFGSVAPLVLAFYIATAKRECLPQPVPVPA